MIKLDKLAVQAGQFALEDISLEVPTGGHAFLMGKTGTGKTTLLEAISGLRPVCTGRVWLMGREVTHLAPAERNLGYVPQDGALFPHLTVREHLAFALVIRRWSQQQIEHRVEELADWLGLAGLLDRKPHGLSGGEAQRVALGRALSFRPEVVCLDEPLSALDDETREEMRQVLQNIRARTGATIFHITHNWSDARKLADVIFVLNDGRIRLSQPQP
jgi:ABC-type sugar transport system ATPase subunit